MEEVEPRLEQRPRATQEQLPDVRVRRRPTSGEQRKEPIRLHRVGASVGSPSLWLLSLGEALRRRSGANAEGGPEGAEGRMPGVRESNSAAEGSRNRARNPPGRNHSELASQPIATNRNRRRENEPPRSRLPTLLHGAGHQEWQLAPRDHHPARSASVTGRRAARNAGNNPPTSPMPRAHFRPVHSSSGVTWNWNTTWLKLPLSVATL
jgi:hypothetical protein